MDRARVLDKTSQTILERRSRDIAGALAFVPGGRFPFPREKGSEKGSGKICAGMGEKPDFLKKSG